MATLGASTEPTVSAAAGERGRSRVALADTFGFLGTWLRLVWRHWPVLLVLAFGGNIVRDQLVDVAIWASRWRDGLGGLLVFPLIPAALLTAMVLMLRVVRPSLPYLGQRSRPESMLAYLGAVLLPFLLFYTVGGYADTDLAYFTHAVQVNIFENALTGDYVTVLTEGTIVVVIAAGAFVLRLVLTRSGAVRKLPLLVLLAVYLEVLWIYTLYRLSFSYRPQVEARIENTRAWQAMVQWWHTRHDPADPLGATLNAIRSVANTFLAQADIVLVAPLTALVAGSVVLAARTRRDRPRPEATMVRRAARVGAEVGRPVGGRLALLADGLRRVFQAGVPATMVFCLFFLVISFLPAALNEPERILVGPADFNRVWGLVSLPIVAFNDAVELMFLMGLIAAFVDRTAARIARRAGVPSTVDESPVDESPEQPPGTTLQRLWGDGEPDVPRQPIRPGNDDRGWSDVGR